MQYVVITKELALNIMGSLISPVYTDMQKRLTLAIANAVEPVTVSKDLVYVVQPNILYPKGKLSLKSDKLGALPGYDQYQASFEDAKINRIVFKEKYNGTLYILDGSAVKLLDTEGYKVEYL